MKMAISTTAAYPRLSNTRAQGNRNTLSTSKMTNRNPYT
jgi:hypothetical protein